MALRSADPSARRYYRADDGRLIAGVAAGLAEHLGISVIVVRAALVLLTVAGGAGLLMYAAFWALVPQRESPGAVKRADLGQLVAFLFFGEGDTAPLAHEVLRRAVQDPKHRPVIHVS